MTSVTKSRSIDAPVEKKTLKKKNSVEEIIKPVQKSKKIIESKKIVEETKKKSTETVKKEKVEKVQKKINVKPTIADTQGLNLSIAKVKNIISNLCINKEAIDATVDIKNNIREVNDEFFYEEFTLEKVSADTIAYLDVCQRNTMENCSQVHSRVVLKGYNSKELEKYETSKQKAISNFNAEQKQSNLFNDEKFNIIEFNQNYNKNFYKDMKNYNPNWKNLEGKDLYDYCMYLVTKNKVRFNSESKIYITAFVEFIIKQLVINGTLNCIKDKKKIIQLEHAVSDIMPKFTMFPLIYTTRAYKEYSTSSQNSSEEDDAKSEAETEIDEEDDEKLDTTNRKLQFKYYVAELCRNVRMELSVEDEANSKYNQTSVSKKFNQFCSDVIIELLQRFGKILKEEVVTRDVKTVNYSIITALVKIVHHCYNLDAKNTISFIQEKYNLHNTFLKERQDGRKEKKGR